METWAVNGNSLHEERHCTHQVCCRVVYLSDAEAEIEKARREGYEEGLLDKNCERWTTDLFKMKCEEFEGEKARLIKMNDVQARALTTARADERERIAAYIIEMLGEQDGMGPAGNAVRKLVLNRVLGFLRGQAAGALEPFKHVEPFEAPSPKEWTEKFNVLVDAVNELRARK